MVSLQHLQTFGQYEETVSGEVSHLHRQAARFFFCRQKQINNKFVSVQIKTKKLAKQNDNEYLLQLLLNHQRLDSVTLVHTFSHELDRCCEVEWFGWLVPVMQTEC